MVNPSPRGMDIEFNGLYWHSEATRGETYHYDKWRACKEQGIQLIQVWEDDWNRNPIQNWLNGMLKGYAPEPRIYARHPIVRELGKTVTDEFLNEYHIQDRVRVPRLGIYNKRGGQELLFDKV